jgi:hypothetical protein
MLRCTNIKWASARQLVGGAAFIKLLIKSNTYNNMLVDENTTFGYLKMHEWSLAPGAW